MNGHSSVFTPNGQPMTPPTGVRTATVSPETPPVRDGINTRRLHNTPVTPPLQIRGATSTTPSNANRGTPIIVPSIAAMLDPSREAQSALRSLIRDQVHDHLNSNQGKEDIHQAVISHFATEQGKEVISQTVTKVLFESTNGFLDHLKDCLRPIVEGEIAAMMVDKMVVDKALIEAIFKKDAGES